MARPRPRPCERSRAGLPSCTKASKMRCWSAGPMPGPLSQTCSTQVWPRRRMPTSTLPWAVWRMALPTRLRRICSSSTGSVHTVASVGRMRRRRPLCRADSISWLVTASSSGCSFTRRRCTSTVPESSRDRSSRPLSRLSIEFTARVSRSVRLRRAGSVTRDCSRSVIRPMAATGWRRSWLAEVRKWLLAALAAASSRVRSATLVSRCWLACSISSKAVAIRLITSMANCGIIIGMAQGNQ